jgi:glycosyltransferase involved in cell wall biosynthesis
VSKPEDQTLISICMPAYKADAFLQETLDSIREQIYSNWELIVVEDGSKDRTEQILSEFSKAVSQPVTFIRHEANRGLPATRNTSIASAKGQWIAFLDSDDLWEKSHLSDLVAAAERYRDALICFSGSQLFEHGTGRYLELRAPSDEDLSDINQALFLSRLIIQPSAVMINRACFDAFGLISELFPICNDLEYWIRVASRGGKFAYSGRVTCLYRKHPSAMSTQSVALIVESAKVCESYIKWEAIPAALRRSHPAELYRNAGRMLLRGDPGKALPYFGNSVRLEPFSPTNYVYWCAASLLRLIKKEPA